MKKLLMGCAAVMLGYGVAAAQTGPTTGPATSANPTQGNAGLHEPTAGTADTENTKGVAPAYPRAETMPAETKKHEGAAGTAGNELKGPAMATRPGQTQAAAPKPHEATGTGTAEIPTQAPGTTIR